jgi:nicotinate-nucleotide adenylyltransferase
MATFVGVTRPGYELSDAHLPTDSVTLLDVPALAISSSACRERVAAGRPVWYLVPDGVVQYIVKHELYRAD